MKKGKCTNRTANANANHAFKFLGKERFNIKLVEHKNFYIFTFMRFNLKLIFNSIL